RAHVGRERTRAPRPVRGARMRLRRGRFGEVIRRQLDVFAEDEARGLFAEVYGDYMDVVEAATEALAEMRWRYAATLDEDAAEEYESEFNRAVRRRWPALGLEIDNR